MSADSLFNALAHVLCWALEWLIYDYWRISISLLLTLLLVAVFLLTWEPSMTRIVLVWAIGMAGPSLGIRWHVRSGD